jgi:hypothetical protein
MSNPKKRPERLAARRSGPNWGPLAVILGGVALLGAALFAVFQGQAAPQAEIEVQGAPRLKVDREIIDFGDVTMGEWVTAEFTLTNVGDQPLSFSETPYVELVEGC